MDKRSVLVVSLLSLLLLFSFRGYAEPTLVINTSIIGNAIYNTSFLYEFSSVWNNSTENENITICNFILGRPDGTFNNYSFIPNSTISPSLCYKNFTQDDLGRAGNYNWTWEVMNDTNWTSTNSYNFTINKATTSLNLSLNDVQGDRSYASNNTANFTVVLNVSGKIVSLSSNYTGWTLQSGQTPFNNYTGFYSVGNWWNLTGFFDDDENYTGSSQTYYFNVTDSTPPAYNSNSTNTTLKGLPVQHDLNWIDNAGLSGYIFSFDNCTGVFNNDTWIPINGLSNWSNVTKTINSTAGCLIRWFISANDTSNNWNISGIFSYNPKLINDANCTANDQCLSGFCLHNICRPSSPFCGDGFCDSGEYCTAESSNCPSSYSCTNGCVAPTTTTPPSSTGSNTPTGSFLIKDLASSLTISQGESKSAQFTLSNTLSNNIANVSFSVSGIDSSWYTLSKSSISILAHGSSQAMTITFNIPNDAEAKNYDVTISAKGKALGETSSRIATKTMTLIVNSSQPQPIQPLPSVTENPQPETVQQNETENITSNQTSSVATGLAPAFEFFKSNLVIILAVAACLLIFIFRNNLTTALTGTIGKEEPEKTHKATSPLKGLKDKLNYKIVVNLKKEGRTKNLKETAEVQGAEKIPEMVPEKEPKRPAMLEKEIKRDIKELQSIIDNENKVKKNKKKFGMNNN